MNPISNLKRTCAALAVISAASNVLAVGTEPRAVQAFYEETANCMYMADTSPENNAAGEQRYAHASGSAVAALRAAEPGLTLDAALLRLRAGCDAALQTPVDTDRGARKSALRDTPFASKGD